MSIAKVTYIYEPIMFAMDPPNRAAETNIIFFCGIYQGFFFLKPVLAASTFVQFGMFKGNLKH